MVQQLKAQTIVRSAVAATSSTIEKRFVTIRAGIPDAFVAAMAGARHFRELHCWQLSNELKLGVYRLSDRTDVKQDFRFREQIRDAAASAPRNIAEGFGRRTHAEFARFLDVARGSLAESQNHLQDAVDRGYLDHSEFARLNSLSERAAAATARLQRYLRGPQR